MGDCSILYTLQSAPLTEIEAILHRKLDALHVNDWPPLFIFPMKLHLYNKEWSL